MRACIHRGTQEIGGTCIELQYQGKRIALDVGLPLDADADEAESLLPAVPGFRTRDDSLLGVVISHPHQDHYGLARHIRPDVPVYIGEAANSILKAAAQYVPNGHWFADARFYRDREAFAIGPFTITPYLVDHSAFDAYALLIEADGRRLYYSGDFRAHGRKAGLVERIIGKPPPDIDVLMMEGTTIGRSGTEDAPATETGLEWQFAQAFEATRGMHFVWGSSQNIDRIVTIFRAAKRARRLVVIDLYTAVVLEATGRNTIPQSWWDDVRLYVPFHQKVHVKENRLFEDLRPALGEPRVPRGPVGDPRAGRDVVPATAHAGPRRCRCPRRGAADVLDVAGLPGARDLPSRAGVVADERDSHRDDPHVRSCIGG